MSAPEGVRKIYKGKSKQYIYEMETAKVWLYAVHIPSYIIKRKDQVYIQTKHWGSFLLKRLSLGYAGHLDFVRKFVERSSNLMDYIISGSEFDEETCRINFNFQGKFLRFGSPKSDVLFSADKYKKKVYDYYNLNDHEKVLMYAPTWRTGEEKVYSEFKWLNLNFEMLYKAIQQRFGGKWKIFLRLHPQVRTRSKQIKRPDYVIDVSGYEDSGELVAASDVLVTDYSSIMAESANSIVPVVSTSMYTISPNSLSMS